MLSGHKHSILFTLFCARTRCFAELLVVHTMTLNALLPLKTRLKLFSRLLLYLRRTLLERPTPDKLTVRARDFNICGARSKYLTQYLLFCLRNAS